MFKNVLLAALALFVSGAWANPEAAAQLQAKYLALGDQLTRNQFNRPLVLASIETPQQVSGEIYAVIDHPFSAVSTGLNNPDGWCDLMSLPMNTKYCRAQAVRGGTVLKVNIGRKTAESLQDASRIEFKYAVMAQTAQYLDIRLDAKDGPMGTSDYRIAFKAVPLTSAVDMPGASAKTFIHLTYSYSVNLAARLAMQTYLATIGRNKVGFTKLGQKSDGTPRYIEGVRGVVERNTMRYCLAIESYLDAASEPTPLALEKRLQSWFTASERYPLQLHELERGAYMAMKRDEYVRQQSTQ